MLKIVWKDVAGDRCRIFIGSEDAKAEDLPAIEHIDQMCQPVR